MTNHTFINWLLELQPPSEPSGAAGHVVYGAKLVPESYMIPPGAEAPVESEHRNVADAFTRVMFEAENRQLLGWTIRTEGVDRVDTPD